MSTPEVEVAGTLALVGGGEWRDGTRDLDAQLLEASGGTEVLVLPTAAAYEHADQVVAVASAHFAKLGAEVRSLPVLHRREAESPEIAETVRDARFVYFADGSPLHLRSVLKGSALFDALLAAYRSGAVLAASGAGATVLCDPMVDPRGGAYTVGLGVVEGRRRLPVPRQRGRPPPRALDRPAPRERRPRRHRRRDRPPPPTRSQVVRRGQGRRDALLGRAEQRPRTPVRPAWTSPDRRPIGGRVRGGSSAPPDRVGSGTYDSEIVTLLIRTFCVGAPSPEEGANEPIFLATDMPARHRAEAGVVVRQGRALGPGHDEELRAEVAGRRPAGLRRRERPDRVVVRRAPRPSRCSPGRRSRHPSGRRPGSRSPSRPGGTADRRRSRALARETKLFVAIGAVFASRATSSSRSSSRSWRCRSSSGRSSSPAPSGWCPSSGTFVELTTVQPFLVEELDDLLSLPRTSEKITKMAMTGTRTKSSPRALRILRSRFIRRSRSSFASSRF